MLLPEDELFPKSAKILSVAELTRSIRGLLETRFGAVWVQGEVSNYKLHPSGHQYFTLKDQRAQIACVIFRNAMLPSRVPLADGAQVQVYGAISVFEARGQYQLSVQIVQTRGAGLLQAKFEALKRKLQAEGLFTSARKRPLPSFPSRIGIVTSPSGAAIRDMLNVLRRRAPGTEILINPVRVQGAGAAAEIAAAIRELSAPNDSWKPVDLIVVTRGGGSIEDLWEFNEEIVARAIFHSDVPVVSAIGHEIDFTIADFVADLRAPTPSAAAELIVPDAADLLRRVREIANCLHRFWLNCRERAQERLRHASERALGRELLARMREAQQTVDLSRDALGRQSQQQMVEARTRLTTALQELRRFNPLREIAACRAAIENLRRHLIASPPRAIQQLQERQQRAESILRVLGPEQTLGRGYSITTDEEGNVIRNVETARATGRICTRVTDGEFSSVVADVA